MLFSTNFMYRCLLLCELTLLPLAVILMCIDMLFEWYG